MSGVLAPLTTHAKFTRILIIQSLPDADGNPGRRLREDIGDVIAVQDLDLAVDLESVASRDELLDALDTATRRSREEGDKPILHFECHGSTQPDGIQLANGDGVTWGDIKPALIGLNVATGCNLFVTLASCYGAELGRILTLADRAPVMAYVGAMDEVTAGAFADGFAAFYECLLTTFRGELALEKLRDASGAKAKYFFMSAPDLLRKAYRGLDEQIREEGGIWAQARVLRENLRSSGIRPLPSLQDMVFLWKETKPRTIERLAAHFFMTDLYPANASRFPVTASDLEAYLHGCRVMTGNVSAVQSPSTSDGGVGTVAM